MIADKVNGRKSFIKGRARPSQSTRWHGGMQLQVLLGISIAMPPNLSSPLFGTLTDQDFARWAFRWEEHGFELRKGITGQVKITPIFHFVLLFKLM